MADVKLELKTVKAVRDAFSRSRGAKRQAVLDEWSKAYSVEMRRRYKKLSRGGGEWPPLSWATLMSRRGGGRRASILIDTATLFASFAPKLVAAVRSGLIKARASFGVQGVYPSGISLEDVARFHQEGAGHLPVRKLLVAPSKASLKVMATKAKRILLPRKRR